MSIVGGTRDSGNRGAGGTGRPSNRRLLGLALMTSIAILAGCGSQTTPSSTGGPSAAGPSAAGVSPAGASAAIGNVCALVPDMDALVGKKALVAPAQFTVSGVTSCIWVYGNSPSRDVTIDLGSSDNHQGQITALGPGTTIPGLGDDARWWPAPETSILSVLKGSQSFQVKLSLGKTVSQDLAVAIARSALQRLD